MVYRCVLLLTSMCWLSSLRGKPREIALFFPSFEIKGMCLKCVFRLLLSLIMENTPQKKKKGKKKLGETHFRGNSRFQL